MTTDQDINDLNLFWLLKTRDLARQNRVKASVVLGLDISLVDEFARLSIGDMNTMAQAGVMLFCPRFRLVLWRELAKCRGAPSLSVRLHTLLSGVAEITDQ